MFFDWTLGWFKHILAQNFFNVQELASTDQIGEFVTEHILDVGVGISFYLFARILLNWRYSEKQDSGKKRKEIPTAASHCYPQSLLERAEFSDLSAGLDTIEGTADLRFFLSRSFSAYESSEVVNSGS